MRTATRKRTVRVFAAVIAATGAIGFASACNDTEQDDDGGTQQEDNGGQQDDGGQQDGDDQQDGGDDEGDG